MARPARKKELEAPAEKPTLTVRFIPYVGIGISELPGIYPVGRDQEQAKARLHGELRKRFPQGYRLKWQQPFTS